MRMKKKLTGLKPQFDRSEVESLERRFLENQKDAETEAGAFKAGAGIGCGDYSRERLKIIYEWKTGGRGKGRLAENSDEEISDALRLAVAARTARAAIAVLTGLYGVEVPVASAVLTAIDQEQYTVIDVRALESLGSKSPDRTVDFYLVYLAYCQSKAKEWGISLRTLDRALWQWSKKKSEEKKKNRIAGRER
jgi:hypothetical protein